MSSNLFMLIVSLLPMSFLLVFFGLELGIAFLQAYVFTILVCSYIKDAVDLHRQSSSITPFNYIYPVLRHIILLYKNPEGLR